MLSSIPTTRERFKGAISAAPTLDAAAGICEAVHKAELRELFEELENAATLGSYTEIASNLERLKHEYCD